MDLAVTTTQTPPEGRLTIAQLRAAVEAAQGLSADSSGMDSPLIGGDPDAGLLGGSRTRKGRRGGARIGGGATPATDHHSQRRHLLRWLTGGMTTAQQRHRDAREIAETVAAEASLAAGFEPAPAARRARLWRWAKIIAVVLVLLSGVVQLVVKPLSRIIAGPQPAASTAVPIDPQRAASVAIRFAVSYLSWAGPAWAATRGAALEPLTDILGTTTSTTGAWSGPAVILADTPVVEGAATITGDAERVAVSVIVRVRAFVTADDTAPSGPPEGWQPVAGGAFIPPVPTTSWIEQPARWLRLSVPLVRRGEQLLVAGSGPVFTGVPTTPMTTPRIDTVPEAKDVIDALPTLLGAYASGDLRYMGADPDMSGLDGVLEVGQVSDTQLFPGPGAGQQTAVSTVAWTYPGTDTSIQQRLALVLQNADDGQPLLSAVHPLADTTT